MRHVQTAVILAAGRGQRLGELGRLAPKGFLRLGELPIVEESILKLRDAGVTDIVIVTGYLVGHYQRLAERYPGLIRLAHNPQFAESGSMSSLYRAAPLLEAGFLLLESDLVYERRALREILAQLAENAILVSGFTQSGDEVYVEADNGLLMGLSKDRRQLGPKVIGELVGISRLSAPLFKAMCRYAESVFIEAPRLEYEHAIVAAVSMGLQVQCCLVPDLVWSEIDDESQLDRARKKTYPAILSSSRTCLGETTDRHGRLPDKAIEEI